MKGPFVLDACAVIAFLNAEEGGDKVKALLEDTENEVYVHMINLCEVYYGFCKADGVEKAEKVMEDLSQLPLEFIDEMSFDFIKVVGKYKAAHRISLADAFVLGLAEKMKARVVTTDHHELDPIDKAKLAMFYWVR